MAERRRRSFFGIVGGRKAFHGYLAYVTLIVMAFVLDASFGEFAIAMLAALGITTSTIAYEDKTNADAAASAHVVPPPAEEEG